MFGLNDSKTQTQDVAPIAPFPQAMASNNSDAATPVPPPMLDQNIVPVMSPAADPAHAASIHSSDIKLPGADSLAQSTGSINLESAYIPVDPPHMADKTASVAKPSAASLVNSSAPDDLLKIKQQALTSLAPLVDHLDQTPEEKFKTTMMLIQASDNAELVPEAYDAANKISDEKVRAQALLDVVNEINYFTQHGINVPDQKPAAAAA